LVKFTEDAIKRVVHAVSTFTEQQIFADFIYQLFILVRINDRNNDRGRSCSETLPAGTAPHPA
ncbi:MAG: hypothetical protein P8X39_08005, partial [Desulfofustis sp.]